MDREKFMFLMEDAVAAYNAGYPVIVFDTEQRPLHGEVTLKRATEHGGAAHVVFGVPRDLFESSHYPQSLTFALVAWKNSRCSNI
jgi:hypothetical protein